MKNLSIALMVKRLSKFVNDDYIESDAVCPIEFSDRGLIFSWGDGDRFEINYADLSLLNSISFKMQERNRKKDSPSECEG